jgi:hypothetical protein
MDPYRLVAWARSLPSVPSRRDVLRSLASAGIGLGALPLAEPVAARNKNRKKNAKKRKHKKQEQVPPVAPPFELPPLEFNEYGCIEVAQACRGDSALCCSGICEGAAPVAGQPDTSRCVAHDTGTCQQGGPGVCTSDAPQNITCNNNAKCRCISTTAGSNVCGALRPLPEMCATCQRDSDCVALGFPAGSACAPFSEGFCGGACASGMVCLTPCSFGPSSEQM